MCRHSLNPKLPPAPHSLELPGGETCIHIRKTYKRLAWLEQRTKEHQAHRQHHPGDCGGGRTAPGYPRTNVGRRKGSGAYKSFSHAAEALYLDRRQYGGCSFPLQVLPAPLGGDLAEGTLRSVQKAHSSAAEPFCVNG